MQKKLILIFTFLNSFLIVHDSVPRNPQDHAQQFAKNALEYTNAYRKKKGLAQVKWHQSIADQATIHSKNMGQGSVSFGHIGFEKRINDIRPKAYSAAENVFMGNMPGDCAHVAVDSWIKSKGHRKNLEGNYSHCGIGVYKNNQGYWYFTQIFVSF